MELQIINNIANSRADDMTQLMLFFTQLGDAFAAVFILIIFVVIFVKLKKINSAILIAASLAFAQIIAHSLKFILQRERPPAELNVYQEYGYSMPSAHAVLAASFYSMVLFQLMKTTKSKYLKALYLIISIILIIAIGYSRIYLGLHWPSDVLAGFGIGLTVNIVLLILEKPILKKPFKKRKK